MAVGPCPKVNELEVGFEVSGAGTFVGNENPVDGLDASAVWFCPNMYPVDWGLGASLVGPALKVNCVGGLLALFPNIEPVAGAAGAALFMLAKENGAGLSALAVEPKAAKAGAAEAAVLPFAFPKIPLVTGATAPLLKDVFPNNPVFAPLVGAETGARFANGFGFGFGWSWAKNPPFPNAVDMGGVTAPPKLVPNAGAGDGDGTPFTPPPKRVPPPGTFTNTFGRFALGALLRAPAPLPTPRRFRGAIL